MVLWTVQIHFMTFLAWCIVMQASAFPVVSAPKSLVVLQASTSFRACLDPFPVKPTPRPVARCDISRMTRPLVLPSLRVLSTFPFDGEIDFLIGAPVAYGPFSY